MTLTAGRPRWWATGLLVVGLLAVGTWWLIPDDDHAVPDLSGSTDRPSIAAEVLRDLEDAVVRGDADAAATLAPPDDDVAEAALRALVENAQDLRVEDFSLRYVDEDGVVSADLDEGQWAAAVDTTWRFAGADARAAHAEVTFTFADDGADGGVVSVGGGDRVSPLWLTTPLIVERADGAVVAVAGEGTRVGAYVARARQAAEVTRSVLGRWRGTLVVLVPSAGADVDAALGVDEGTHTNIAAVTATADGSLAPGSPLRVFLNRDVYDDLRGVGAQVVMSHEAVHVATEAPTSRAPLWLLEGFADYVALRDVDLPLSVTANQIVQQVRDNGPPTELPDRSEFDTRTAHLGAAYESAWIACRLLVDVGGEDALVELNRRVGMGEELEKVLEDVFGFGEQELVRRWRDGLVRLAG